VSLPVAILAGGLATRLRPITEQIPKSLVPVAGRPFAEHQIELLRSAGVRDIVFLLGHLGEMVQDALGDGSRWGVRLRYAFDGPVRLGTGGALRQALPLLGDPFFVLYGDSYLECDYADIERTFAATAAPALMTVCRNDDRWDRSNVAFADGRILRYDKRETHADMHHIDYGLGVFRHRAFDRAEPDLAGGTFDLADLYGRLVARGELAAYDVQGRFYEIGSPAGLAETDAHLGGVRESTR
jgi:NDP-sugar pyrophosphorylase family protein